LEIISIKILIILNIIFLDGIFFYHKSEESHKSKAVPPQFAAPLPVIVRVVYGVKVVKVNIPEPTLP
jgi:hypothetical protein